MATPLFLVQIVEVEPPHAVVRFHGGSPLERDFINACTEAIVAKGVGLLRTEAQVKVAIHDGITETIRTLKWHTKGLV